MYRDNSTNAIAYTKRYSTGIAYETVGMANSEKNKLMTKIAVEE
jgi:dipeptidase